MTMPNGNMVSLVLQQGDCNAVAKRVQQWKDPIPPPETGRPETAENLQSRSVVLSSACQMWKDSRARGQTTAPIQRQNHKLWGNLYKIHSQRRMKPLPN